MIKSKQFLLGLRSAVVTILVYLMIFQLHVYYDLHHNQHPHELDESNTDPTNEIIHVEPNETKKDKRLNAKKTEAMVKQAKNIISRWESIFVCAIGVYNYTDTKNNSISNQTQNECHTILAETNFQSLIKNTYHTINSNILKFSFHHMISLRRQILIVLYLYDIKLNIDSILNMFCIDYQFHKNNVLINKYQWFHLHVSKCAGRAMQETFETIFGKKKVCSDGRKRINLKCKVQYNFRSSCRYVSRENPAYTVSDEQLLSNIFTKKKKHHLYPKPSICEKFVYILPIREPIERILSHAAQVNQRPAFFDMDNILRRKDSYLENRRNFNKLNKNNNTSTSKKTSKLEAVSNWIQDICYDRDIIINGVKYRLLVDGVDYRGYFKLLIDTELKYFDNININVNISNASSIIIVNDNNNTFSDTNSSDSELIFLSKDEIINRESYLYRVNETSTVSHYNLYQFEVPLCFRNRGNVELFPIDHEFINYLNESQFIYVVPKGHRLRRANIERLRTITSSNIYTSWFGYQSEYYKKFTWLPNYVSRSKISHKHLLNAIDFILKIDYILPFSTKKVLKENINDKLIWNIALRDIYNYYINVTKHIPFDNSWKINNDFVYYQRETKKQFEKEYLYHQHDDHDDPSLNSSKSHRFRLQWANRWISKADPYRRVMPNDIWNSISDYEKELLYQWNKFDIKLYRIAKLIEMADLKFYRFVKDSQCCTECKYLYD